LFVLATLREATASASERVEELCWPTETRILADLALAALVVPGGTAWTFVGNDGLTRNRVDLEDHRNTKALALTVVAVPDEVDLALLDVARALALLGVPVVGFIDAGLGSTDPFAGL
jgi:hypothetical protein